MDIHTYIISISCVGLRHFSLALICCETEIERLYRERERDIILSFMSQEICLNTNEGKIWKRVNEAMPNPDVRSGEETCETTSDYIINILSLFHDNETCLSSYTNDLYFRLIIIL